MANLTRINNNQITDAVSGNTQLGINANTKIQPYSITSALLANNITYGSDLTVSGNLTVNGNSTAIDTTNTTIEDPLLLLASTQTGSPTVDIGYIGQRGTSNNIAFVWQESSSQFVTVFTNSGATDNTVVNILSYADFATANANVTGNLIAGNVSLLGNVTSALNVTGNIAAGNIAAVGLISATGNIATANFFVGDGAYISNINAGNVATYKISNGNSSANIGNAAGNMVVTINGNLNSTFYDNGVEFTGNISATGNISTGDYFVGDGYYISNINPGNVSTTKITNGGSFANIASSDGNLVIAIGATSNSVATFYDNGVEFAGNISATGNVTGGNISTTGNVTGGNISATGNVTGGNITTAGDISATGNITANTNLSVIGTAFTGNIIPNLDNVYSLGNSTNIFSSLYLSPDTLYLGTTKVGANNTSNTLSVGSNIAVTYSNGNADITATGNIISGNVNTGNLSLTGNVISNLNVTLNATAGNVNAVANVSAGGNVVAFDAVNAANLSLSGNVIANLNATFNVNANNITTVNYVSATGNVYGANFATTGAQGNITGANVVSAITFTATGNVYANNISATNLISATGNIDTQQSFNGNALRGNTLAITSTAGGLLFSITGNINVANTYINNVPTPVQSLDAVNKQYVDDVVQGLNIHDSTIAATPNTLAVISGGTVSYNNGNAGVGANLVTTGTYTNIDGVAINTLGTRILVKDEANTAWNGIYTYSNSTVLIRATDYDTVPEVEAGDFVLNLQGNTYGNTGWVQTSNTQVIGTDPIVFTQFSGAQNLTGGNAIAVVGTVINALYDGNTVGVNGSNQLYIPANALLTTPNIGSATGANLSILGSVIGNIFQAETLSVTGNAQIGNISTGNLSLSGNVLTNLNVTADVNAGNLVSYGLLSVVGNALVGNITTGNISLTGNVLTNLNVTTDVTSNNVYAVNNFSAGGNVYGGIISASGNVYGANISSANIYDTNVGAGQIVFGNADASGLLSSLSTLTTDGNNLSAGGNISAAGNVTAANFITSGSGGNITGANVISAVTLTASGNVYGNVGIFTSLTATGNVGAGSFLFGDGYYISNINAGNVSSTKIINGGSYANIASADGNLVIAVGAGSNVAATFYDTGVNFGGNISVNGNVTGANFVGNLSGGLGSNLTVNNYVIQGGNYNGITLAMPVGFGANLSSAYEGGVTLAAGTSGTTAGTLVLDQTGNVSASGNVYATGNLTGANILTAGNVSATGNATVGNVLTAGLVSATANVIGGNVLTAGYVSSTGNIQSGTTLLVDTTTSSVSLGANVTETAGATLAINATDSMLIPVGNIAQRPATPATGMLRYNSTVSQCEIWNGAAWVAVGGSTYTVITNEQFNGDGTTVTFTLGSSQTTDSCIVTINGVVQIPTTAYSVSGVFPTCVLTFTEAPQVSDIIDVREITTTTSVTAIANSPGNAIVSVSPTIGQVNTTGNLVAQLNPVAPSLTANSTMSFQLINNTTLAILVRGTDGTTRSANITLT